MSALLQSCWFSCLALLFPHLPTELGVIPVKCCEKVDSG